MKKKVTIAFVITGILAISTMIIFSTYKSSEAYRKAKAKTQWECSVVCAEKSTPDSYVITYSDVKILSNTGVLTVQNRNDFDITVHLLCAGKQELVSGTIRWGRGSCRQLDGCLLPGHGQRDHQRHRGVHGC